MDVHARREAARRPNGQFGFQDKNAPSTILLSEEDSDLPEARQRMSLEHDVNVRALETYVYEQSWMGAHRFTRGYTSPAQLREVREEITGWVHCYMARHQKTKGYVTKHGIRMAVYNTVSRLRILEELTGSIYGDPNSLTSSVISARKVFHQECERIRREEGRELSLVQKKSLATFIHEGWADKNHRPGVDSIMAALRYEDQSEDYTLEHQIDASHSTHDEYGPFRHYGGVDVTSLGRAEATRLYVSTALNDTHYGEGIIKRDMSYRLSRATRAIVKNSGKSVIDILHQWEKANDDAVTEAFWQPFHDLSDRQKEKVAELFYTHPERADELWGHILTAATKPNK